jgi:heat shock protein HslJ
MGSTFVRATASLIAILTWVPALNAQGQVTSWLDNPKPAGWNMPGQIVPSAPKPGAVDARCRASVRPVQLAEDKQVRDRGWDLIGAFQGGWQTVVIRAAAAYDGMCRPRQYQDFVFVRGIFAGTLSPQPMDSRTDGAIGQVGLSGTQLTAEYTRYAPADALCCPSRMTSVIFDIVGDKPVVRPASASTSNTTAAQGPSSSGSSSAPSLAGTSWRLVRFEGGDDTVLKPDDPSKYTIELAAGGQLTARIDCNRGRGTWKSASASQIEFGPMALTRAQCPPGSLHDQIVKQWGNIRSYVIRDGHLFLALMADGGIYEFEPIARSK